MMVALLPGVGAGAKPEPAAMLEGAVVCPAANAADAPDIQLA